MQEAASPPSATQSSEFIEELSRQRSNSLGATPSRSVSKNVSFSFSARYPPPSQINERSDSRSKWLPAESSHYRPCQLDGEGARLSQIPVVVRVRANVLRVINVDLQAQCFTAVYQLEASWVAPELKMAAERLGKRVSELTIDQEKSDQDKFFLADAPSEEAFFAPRLFLNNLVSLKPEESEEWFTVYEGATEEEDPVVCFRWKFKGTFQEIMELGNFPFDVQNLTVEIRTGWEADHKKKGVLLVENQKARCVRLAPPREFCTHSHLLGRTPPTLSPPSPLCWPTLYVVAYTGTPATWFVQTSASSRRRSTASRSGFRSCQVSRRAQSRRAHTSILRSR